MKTTSFFAAAVALACFAGLNADAAAPKVTITSPGAGARSNAPVTFKGTASETGAPIASVNYWITNLNGSLKTNGQAVLAAGAGSVSNWTASVTPFPGSNIFAVQSQDFSGNVSPWATLKFFVKSNAQLTLITNTGTGSGKVTGYSYIHGDAVPAAGAMLNIGEAYLIEETPGKNSYFSNWTGANLNAIGPVTGSELRFIMEPGTSITANFITNIFTGMAGTYYGLFSNANVGITEETAGLIGTLSLTPGGAYSATVYQAGSGYGISGKFTPEGYATNICTNALDGHETVELYVNANSAPRKITGSVTGTNVILSNGVPVKGWTSAVTLYASLTNATLASNYAGSYVLLIEPGAGSIGTAPPGDSFAMLTNYPGTASVVPTSTLTGLLSDWASLTQGWPLCENIGIPVYVNYYNTPNPGMLYGTISLTNTNIPSGALTWIRKASSTFVFTNGFTNYPVVQGGRWPNSFAVDTIIAPNSRLVVSGAGLTAGLTNLLYASNNAATTNLYSLGGSTNYGYGGINTNTGQFSFVFTNDNGTGRHPLVPVAAYGAVLTNGVGGGFFYLGPPNNPTNFGSFTLLPP